MTVEDFLSVCDSPLSTRNGGETKGVKAPSPNVPCLVKPQGAEEQSS